MSPSEAVEAQNQSNAGYRGRIANSERPREGRSAVLVDHSTEGSGLNREGGEVMLKRPTGGKVKQGITFSGWHYGRYTEITNHITKSPGNCSNAQWVRVAKVMRPLGCRLMGFSRGNAGEPRNRMREIFTSGSVGRALGNQCLYPERDAAQNAAAQIWRLWCTKFYGCSHIR